MAKNNKHYAHYMREAFQAGMPSYSVATHPECPQSPFDMCLTQKALMQILETVGSKPPETGAKIFSHTDYFGIETVEFDHKGSGRAGGAVYSPDTRWGMERIQYHMQQPEIRLWSGDIHSHPGGFGYPSPKSGPGLGDLGYVEEVFEQNEMMEYFLLPILTGASTGHVVIHPWVCHRGNPVELMTAKLKIHQDDLLFPKRIFNSEWEQRLNQTIAPETKIYETTEAPHATTETTVNATQNCPVPVLSKTAVPLTPMRSHLPAGSDDTHADARQDKATFIPPLFAQEDNRQQGMPPKRCLNPDKLNQVIKDCPEVKAHVINYTIILSYEEMICEVHYTDKRGAEVPEIYVYAGGVRRTFHNRIWDKFPALALEDRLLACCNYCINHMKEEVGKVKQ